MYKAYKYRIYPTDAQKVLLDKHFGCVRFVYNLALEAKTDAYKKGVIYSAYDLMKQLTELKKDCPWLNEVSIGPLQQSIFNLDNAYKKFFKGFGFPGFKKKTNSGSFTVRQNIHVKDNAILIPKFQEGIKVVKHRKFDGSIRSVTVSKTPTNKYFASVLVEQALDILKPVNNESVGIDLGIKTFAVLSNGKEYASPNNLRKALDRLAILKRRASKKKKGSANRRKANLRVAIMHERIANKRNDFLHKVSSEITNQNGIICIEDLGVANMVRNHKLALSISDAGWSLFTNMMDYKTDWKGGQLIKVGRFEPTSKTCSNCGNVQDMPLVERTYNCLCGLSIDRDLNAAINIKNSGLLRASEPAELPTFVGAMKQEKRMQ